MLMQTSRPCNTKFAPSHASHLQGLSFDLMPETKNNTNYSTCSKHHSNSTSDVLNCKRNCSQLSTSSTMTQNFTATLVYQRRRQHKKYVPFFTIHQCNETKPSNGCHSAISSDDPSKEHMVSISEHETEGLRPHGCLGGKEVVTNDNCSSSKSNLALSSPSLKIDLDEAGECSSSGAIVAEKLTEKLTERDICISILKSQGILDKVWTRRGRKNSSDNTRVRRDKYCTKPCKVCRHLESTSNMLVCDSCEDAFHLSCCNRNMIPVGEWLCGSCLRKKHKKSACNSSVNISGEIGGNRCSELEGELWSLEFMFNETEPYMSNVRIGDEFQADVPDWTGPVYDDCGLTGEPLEVDPSNNSNMQECGSTKPLNLSSIGNWLQCREAIEGVGESDDAAVCGKWRRAPLFEVQTHEFECFHCVLWDPARADCAVPQEVETEEVMKQLKYIEMLRPRLAAKRRRLDCSKSSGSQERSR